MNEEHDRLIKILEREHDQAEKRFIELRRALNVARGLVWETRSLRDRLEVMAKIKGDSE